MNRLLPLITIALLGCSKKSTYQAPLDSYFKKNDSYQPISFKVLDTVTLDERRLFLLAPLKRAYRPGYDSLNIKLEVAYQNMMHLGMTDDFIIEGLRKVSDRKIKAIYDLKTMDSLQSLLNGFDSKLPYRINGEYTFLNGADTFKYYVVFNDSLKVIDAVKMH